MKNFWTVLAKPFTILAPMEDVTDVVFREIVAETERPDVFFTEFTSADGLASRGRKALIRKFKFTENQRPIVAQIWGSNPDSLRDAASLVRELGFDGVDINMGCPVPAVMRRNSGSGIIGNNELAGRVISAVKEGAQEIPVSVKTRLGIDKVITEEWVPFLLDQKIAALTIHGRIAVQMSKGDADWAEIGRAVKIRDARAPDTLIIGNGDIKSYTDVTNMHNTYGVDGVMIGRGIFHNPWVFEKIPRPHSKQEHIEMMKKHLILFHETWGDGKNFELMKKFFKMYVKSFDGANELRQQLMERKKFSEMMEIIDTIQFIGDTK